VVNFGFGLSQSESPRGLEGGREVGTSEAKVKTVRNEWQWTRAKLKARRCRRSEICASFFFVCAALLIEFSSKFCEFSC